MNVGDKIKIAVTEEDIASGERGNACECPIAIAIKRATECSRVYVSYDWPRFISIASSEKGGKVYDYKLDAESLNFMSSFDNGSQVSPFSFELTISRISNLNPLADFPRYP